MNQVQHTILAQFPSKGHVLTGRKLVQLLYCTSRGYSIRTYQCNTNFKTSRLVEREKRCYDPIDNKRLAHVQLVNGHPRTLRSSGSCHSIELERNPLTMLRSVLLLVTSLILGVVWIGISRVWGQTRVGFFVFILRLLNLRRRLQWWQELVILSQQCVLFWWQGNWARRSDRLRQRDSVPVACQLKENLWRIGNHLLA